MQNYYLSLIVPEFVLTYYLSLPCAFLSSLPIRKVLLGSLYIFRVHLGG